jgi:2',3'-cyclic-nucleotide 2'-phosphodiesterase
VGDNATILFVGDVVGGLGRRTLLELLPELRRRYTPTFVVVNGENSAGGLGITPKIAQELFAADVDVITLGNHAYHRREILPYLDQEPRLLRPHNYLRSHPGSGVTTVERDGVRLGVINLAGNVFLSGGRPAFPEADAALISLEGKADHVLVDFHAEATSEKVAMGWHLDGRVLAVLGTHTHVPTADGRVLPGGTAYISDVGMTGSRAGVIGVRAEQALEGFRTQMPVRFDGAEGDVWIMGAVVDVRSDGLADSIEQVLLPVEELDPAGG